MYKEYFGFKEPPFSISPDPRYLYMSVQYQDALAHLLYGIKSEGGFVLLTGEVGTGKTTISRRLLEQVPGDTDIAFILNPRMSVEEFLAAVCDDLNIPYPDGNRSIKVFVDHINAYLIENYARGRKTVLIIEEAQNLSTDVMEQVRLLTNLETSERKLLQIIMLGQPELKKILARPELRQLAQRITARFHLGPLSKKDVVEYVNHRLKVAGMHRELFLQPALDKLFRLSGGIPRIINVICDRALLGAYVEGKEKVDKQTLVKAASEVFGEHGSEAPMVRREWVYAGIVLIIFAAAAVIFYAYKEQTMAVSVAEHQSDLPKTSEQPRFLPPPFDADRYAGQPVEQSRETAYTALFGQWGIPYGSKGLEAACSKITSRGLGCLTVKGSMKSMLSLNRPAAVKLSDNRGRQFYTTVTKQGVDIITMIAGGEELIVGSEDLALHWAGEYTLLWQVPPHYKKVLLPGSKGDIVLWLDKQISLLEGSGYQPRNITVFDDELVTRVRRFQHLGGLVPDGIVGPQTIIHLNSKIGSGEPLLAKQQEK